MSDANISAFLRTSQNLDNDVTQYNFNSGSYNDRAARRRKSYLESWYKVKKGINVDVDTGEILDFVPKPMRRVTRSFNTSSFPKMPMPKAATVINIALIGGVGLVAYKLYHKFFGTDASDVISNTADVGKLSLSKTYVDTSGAKAAQLTATASSLASKGLQVTQLHQSLANTIHGYLDSAWVDHDKIVKMILGQGIQTFRLMSVAYGTRSLQNYGNSFAHVLNTSSWSLDNLFSKTKYVGTLKDHLQEVLTSDEQTKIRSYLSVI